MEYIICTTSSLPHNGIHLMKMFVGAAFQFYKCLISLEFTFNFYIFENPLNSCASKLHHNIKVALGDSSMYQSIENLRYTNFGGRRFTRKQIVEIKSTVGNFTKLSRRELANTVCEHLNLCSPFNLYRSLSRMRERCGMTMSTDTIT